VKLARRDNAEFSMFLIAKVPTGRPDDFMSYVSAYFHCVFKTKERQRFISPQPSYDERYLWE
jgi:hypothetical protein